VDKKLRITTICAVSMLFLSGCTGAGSSEPSSNEPKNMNRAQMEKEYASAIQSLEMPEGVSYPDAPKTPTVDGVKESDVTWQNGAGEADAIIYWNCLWGHEWLKYQGKDQNLATNALKMYKSILDQPAFKKYFDAESFQPVIRENIEKAELGDPSGIKADMQSSCRGDLW